MRTWYAVKLKTNQNLYGLLYERDIIIHKKCEPLSSSVEETLVICSIDPAVDIKHSSIDSDKRLI